MLKRWIFYLIVLGLGYALSFFVGRTLALKQTPHAHSPFSLNQQALQIPLPQEDKTQINSAAPSEELESPPDSLPEGAQEEIDMTVDLTLPSLESPPLSQKQLLTACRKTYPQYHSRTRYDWAKSFMGFRTQSPQTLKFYIQDDEIWGHFSKAQQQLLMEDLLNCDPLSRSNSKISEIQILSSRDSSILSKHQR